MEELLREGRRPLESGLTAHLRHARHELLRRRERLGTTAHELADDLVDLCVEFLRRNRIVDQADVARARR